MEKSGKGATSNCAPEGGDGAVLRPMEDGDEEETAALIHRSFWKYIAHTYTPEGVDEFLRNTTPEALAARRQRGQRITVAVVRGRIVGVIAVRDGHHISLLFVDERRHRSGTARRLVSAAVAEARASNPALSFFTVDSSPFAVKFYERIGFRAAGPEGFMRGMRVTPMRMELAP